MGMFGDEATLRKPMDLFNADRKGGPAIDPSIRPGGMANVGRRADAEIFAELVRRMTTATRVEDGWVYASALARAEDPALARQFLGLTLGDAVPNHMVSWLPGMVADNYTHGAMIHAFVLDNFDALSRKTSERGRTYLLPGAASGFNESAPATALIADQKRLLGDSGEKDGAGNRCSNRPREAHQDVGRCVARRKPLARHDRGTLVGARDRLQR